MYKAFVCVTWMYVPSFCVCYVDVCIKLLCVLRGCMYRTKYRNMTSVGFPTVSNSLLWVGCQRAYNFTKGLTFGLVGSQILLGRILCVQYND